MLLTLSACSYFSHDDRPSKTTVAPSAEQLQPAAEEIEAAPEIPAVKPKNQVKLEPAITTATKSTVAIEKTKPTASVIKATTKTAPTPPKASAEKTVKKQAPAKSNTAIKKDSPVITVKKTAPAAPSTGSLKGSVRIMGNNSQTISPNDVIINLEPLGPVSLAQKKAHQHKVDTRNKKYQPGILTIQTNDTLVFKNFDAIKHNVFSSSGKNTFDLGTYGLNQSESVTLKSSGIVKVYCNIHPAMVTFISVSDHNISAITDMLGQYRIDNIPPGTYRLHAWHLRAELDKIVTIKAGQTLEDALELNGSSFTFIPHLNKFGESYKKKPAIFDDEFY